MSRKQDIIRLTDLAQLTLDHRLGQMRAATQALDRSKTQLAAISEGARPAELPLVAGAQAEWTYQRWADLRKSELNLVIARQTAACLAARDEAKTAFGRLEALRGLSRRLQEQ